MVEARIYYGYRYALESNLNLFLPPSPVSSLNFIFSLRDEPRKLAIFFASLNELSSRLLMILPKKKAICVFFAFSNVVVLLNFCSMVIEVTFLLFLSKAVIMVAGRDTIAMTDDQPSLRCL